MPLKIYTEDEAQLIENTEEYFKQFQKIVAAGGLVTNDKGEILMIFRRSKWDLPKGKLENNEPLELCADREIKEETGLTSLLLQKKLITTFHTYVEKDKQVLKETHWYQYLAPGYQEVAPQTEEEITRIDWVVPDELPTYTNNTYNLIMDVLESAGYTAPRRS